MHNQLPISIPKTLVSVCIMIIIALAHAFRIGQIFDGQLYILYYSYFSDFVIPFGMYFLVAMNDINIPFLRPWYVKAGIVFSVATILEILQFFGYYALGETFDFFDILMYGLGVLAAAALEVKLFAKYINFWTVKKVD